jgi:hypothetical protein
VNRQTLVRRAAIPCALVSMVLFSAQSLTAPQVPDTPAATDDDRAPELVVDTGERSDPGNPFAGEEGEFTCYRVAPGWRWYSCEG